MRSGLVRRIALVVAGAAMTGCQADFLGAPDRVPAGSPTRAPEPAPDRPEARSGLDDHSLVEVSDRIFELTNQARRARGLRELQPHPALFEAARKHAVQMAEHDFLSHESLDGSTMRERLPADFRLRAAAENIWGGSGIRTDSHTLAAQIFSGWMDSGGHRRNIESAAYAYLGIAVASSGGEIRAVQVFASEGR